MIQLQPSDEEKITLTLKQDAHFLKFEPEHNKKYITQLQIAKYGDLKEIASRDIILNAGTDASGCLIIYVIGQRQPADKVFQQFIQQFIHMMDDKMNSGFILVYFNSGLMTHSSMSKFFEFYKTLPLKFYSKMRKLLVVHGNIILKSWLWFQNSIENQVLKTKLTLIPKLSDLIAENFMTKFSYVLIPSFIKESDPSNQTLMLHVTAHDQNPHKEEHKTPVTISKVLGLHLHEYELNRQGIPIVIDVLVTLFVNNEAYLKLEGIFRKNAAASKELEVEAILSKKQYHQLDHYDDPYTLAGVLKKIIDKMPTPLIPFTMYRSLLDGIKDLDDHSQVMHIKDTLKALPEINEKMFSFIIGFLKHVSTYHVYNKMTAYNVSVVFGPCFLRPETYTMADLIDAGQVVKIVRIIIESNNIIYPDQYFDDFLEKSEKIRSQSAVIVNNNEPIRLHRTTIDQSTKI